MESALLDTLAAAAIAAAFFVLCILKAATR